jgi:hypothetical protein
MRNLLKRVDEKLTSATKKQKKGKAQQKGKTQKAVYYFWEDRKRKSEPALEGERGKAFKHQ